MPAAQRSNTGKETQPLLQPRSPSAGTGPGPQAPPVQTSIGRPSPKFLGLYLWQWGLVALAAVCLYGIYLVGAALAWRHGGRRYHYFVLAVGCLSGVRRPPVAKHARGRLSWLLHRSGREAGRAGTMAGHAWDCKSRRVVAVSIFACALRSPDPPCLASCHPQAWCLVQIAHTLCCPGLMFTTVDTEERHGLPPSSSLPGVEGRAERIEGPINRV